MIAQFDPARPGEGIVDQAVAILAEGGVIAFPTDTVYGLGCRADSPAAVRRIYSVKGRDRGKPLVLMIRDAAALAGLASSIPPAARILMERFWPGPLTIVLTASRQVRDWRLDKGGTIGVRQSAELVMERILARLDVPLATTSANPSGQREALSGDEVARALARPVDLILDGGAYPARTPSTVVDLSGPAPLLLRKGAVARAGLERALGGPVKLGEVDVMFVCTGNTCRSPMAEGYLRHLLPKQWRNRVRVHSSGTGALPGMPATAKAVTTAQRAGFAIDGHRSTLLTDRVIRQADLVVALEEHHRQAVRALVPDATPILLAPDGVPDPIGGELSDYQETLEIVRRKMPDVVVLIGELLG